MDVAAAIADPIRRDIMTMLKSRMMSAGEIASRFAISRPAISRHLRVLRECGLLTQETRGRQRLYRLDTAPLAPLETWLARLHEDRWTAPFDALETEVYRTRRERRASPSTPEEKTA
jgi:DNA-binding transcriptional ArsR family regulator